MNYTQTIEIIAIVHPRRRIVSPAEGLRGGSAAHSCAGAAAAITLAASAGLADPPTVSLNDKHQLPVANDADRDLLADRELRKKVVALVRGAGFRFVVIDLEGYRTGSLNP